jgi:alpha-methylacyl-CoA racemase
VPPLNLIGDYGGGTMFMIVGILAALFERARSGKGQVIDAAMTDGASMLALPIFSYLNGGAWEDRRGANLLDSGAPFYDTYATSDGKHVAVACLEPPFFAEFARLLPLDPAFVATQHDRASWPAMRDAIATRFAEKPRDEWISVFAGSDACVAPVLSLTEAVDSGNSRVRKAHVDVDGFRRPAPVPRFSRSVPWPVGPEESVSTTEIMDRFGLTADDAKALVGDAIARQ